MLGKKFFILFYFSAIIEHTRQVIFLEDNDVAFVENGLLSIHCIKRDGTDPSEQTREVQQINTELQEIMLGSYKTFMQKVKKQAERLIFCSFFYSLRPYMVKKNPSF